MLVLSSGFMPTNLRELSYSHQQSEIIWLFDRNVDGWMYWEMELTIRSYLSIIVTIASNAYYLMPVKSHLNISTDYQTCRIVCCVVVVRFIDNFIFSSMHSKFYQSIFVLLLCSIFTNSAKLFLNIIHDYITQLWDLVSIRYNWV